MAREPKRVAHPWFKATVFGNKFGYKSHQIQELQGSRLRFIDDLIDSDTKCECDAMCVTFTGKAWRFSLEVKYWTQRLVTAWASPNGGRYMLWEKQVLSRRSNSFLWRNRNQCKAHVTYHILALNIAIKDIFEPWISMTNPGKLLMKHKVPWFVVH